MRLKKLNFNKTKRAIIILILLSGFFIMHEVLWAKDGGIVIAEIMYDPSGNDNREGEVISYEWVELRNLSKIDVDISKWEIRIGKYYKPFKLLKGIPAEGRVVIYLGVGLNQNIDFKNGKTAHLYLNEKGSKLGDSYGEVALYNEDSNNEKTIVDYALYKIPLENRDLSTSYTHAVDGKIWTKDCFLNDLEEGQTLILENNKCKYFNTHDNGGGDEDDDGGKKYSGNIRINEILPNPVGSDIAGEYMELYNPGEKDIDLSEGDGWTIEDRVGDKKENLADNKYNKLYFSKYPKDKIIKAGDFLVIKRESGFGFSLSNSDEIILRDSNGAEVDRIEYGGAREGISYNYCEKTNKWRWSEFLTPGAKNEFKEMEEIEIKIDDNIYKDIYAIFEVSIAGVKDKDLKVKWEFGDGKNSYKAKTKHKYSKNGEYVVKLAVSGSSEDIKKEFNIKVEDFPERKVSIVSINPNPRGKDTESEWIELKNKSKKKVNLKNWSIATGGSKKKLVNHPIYEDFIIKAGKIKQLTREFAKFSLGNKKGYVELRYPNGEVAYKLKYKKEDGVDENEIFKKKEGGGWEWLMGEKTSTNNDDESIDSPENKIIKVEERKEEEVGDIDLIRDMTPEDVGKYSEKERADLIAGYLKEELASLEEKPENISFSDRQVWEVWNNKMKKIRAEDAFYYFNPKGKEEKHYLVKFWEDALGVI